MAFRPYIKNSDGTLTDIPLQAEVAVKLGTANIGGTNKPVYLVAGTPKECGRTIPYITLNGGFTTEPSMFAPTSVGTSGYILKSNGSGAPVWVTPLSVAYVPVVRETTVTCTLTGGTSTRTYSRVVRVVDMGTHAVVSFHHSIDPAYVSKQGTWYTFNYAIPASAFSSVTGRSFANATLMDYSLLKRDGAPQNAYANAQSQYYHNATYSDSGGMNISFAWAKFYGEDTANHTLICSFLITK